MGARSMVRRAMGSFAIILALVSSACGGGAQTGTTGSPSSGTTTQTLKLGAAVALTGALSYEGKLVKDGYEIWQKAVNDKGGIAVGNTRYKVEIVVYDDESKAETGARLTEKLITEDKVSFILGPFSSGIATATSTISERYRQLTIMPLANADGIYERGYKYVFSILPPGSNYLKGLIDMGLTLNPQPKKLALLMRDDIFGIVAGEGGAKYAESKGYQIVFKEKFPANATDVSTILTRVKATSPDMVLATTLFQDTLLITKQAKDLQFAPKLMGFTVGPALPDFIGSLKKDAEYVYGSEWWLPSLKYSSPVFGSTKDYADLVKKSTGNEAGYHIAAASMAGLVLQLAIEKAGTVETEAVRKALLGLQPETFWGPIGWDESGKNTHGTTIPVQIQGGRVTAVWPKEGRESEPKYPTPSWSAR